MTSKWWGCPSRHTSARSRRILSWSDCHRHLGPVLVEEPERDAEEDDDGDDDGVGWITGDARHPGAYKEQHDERVSDLTHQHVYGPDTVRPDDVRSVPSQSLGRIRRGESVLGASEFFEDLASGHRGRGDHVQNRRCDLRLAISDGDHVLLTGFGSEAIETSQVLGPPCAHSDGA